MSKTSKHEYCWCSAKWRQPPRAPPPLPSPTVPYPAWQAWRPSATVHKGALGYYVYVLYDHWISQPAKRKVKMTARNDFHRLRFLPISLYYVFQFAFKTLSHHFTTSVHSKGYGLQRSAISCPLSGSCSHYPSWLWLAPSALSELRFTNTSGVREFQTVEFPFPVSLSSFLSTLSFARSLLVSPTPVSRAWLSDFVPVCVCVMFFLSSVVVFVFSRVCSC